MNILSIAGVVYDIAGAVLIARALVFAREKILAAQSASVVRWNPAVFAALEEQRHDARFGVSILIVGFVLQLLASVGIGLPETYWPWFLAALLLAFVAYFAIGQRMKSTRQERLARLMKGVRKVEDLL